MKGASPWIRLPSGTEIGQNRLAVGPQHGVDGVQSRSRSAPSVVDAEGALAQAHDREGAVRVGRPAGLPFGEGRRDGERRTRSPDRRRCRPAATARPAAGRCGDGSLPGAPTGNGPGNRSRPGWSIAGLERVGVVVPGPGGGGPDQHAGPGVGEHVVVEHQVQAGLRIALVAGDDRRLVRGGADDVDGGGVRVDGAGEALEQHLRAEVGLQHVPLHDRHHPAAGAGDGCPA